MADRLGWQLTCVLDEEPKGQYAALMKLVTTATYVWPANPQSYAKATGSPRFGVKEDINGAKIENFRQALASALVNNAPDLILINTPDAVDAVESTHVPVHSRVVFYTHHENLFDRRHRSNDVFSDSYNQFLYRIGERPNVIVATQTAFNMQRLDGLKFSNVPVVLPMPIPDQELLRPINPPSKEGVLFIGRHEPRKAPKVFAEKVAKAGLSAKILTNKLGATKFKKTLQDAGVQHFDIQFELTGQAKADFIASAKIAFHTSRSESYGFCAMETLIVGLPTLCLLERGWWKNFADQGVHTSTMRDASAQLKTLYGASNEGPIDWHAREQATEKVWTDFLSVSASRRDVTTVGIIAEQVANSLAKSLAPGPSEHGPLFEVEGTLQDYTQSPSLQNVALYLPAVSPTFVEPLDGEMRAIWGSVTNHDLQFLNPSSKLFYYPWCLYSAGQAAKTAAMADKENWLTRAKSDPKVTVLGDSGGFQVQQGTITFKPDTTERMLRWMERVATHSMTLDFPTGGISLGSLVPHIQRLEKAGSTINADAKKHRFSTGFMACLIQSEINLDVFQRLRVPGETQLLNVIQGRNDRESQFWYDRVKGYNLEGWAFAGNHHTQLSMTLRRLIEMQKDGHLAQTKWIHFLGISTLRAGVALTYLQRAMRRHKLGAADVQLSFDSSSPTQAAAQGYQAIIGSELSPAKWTFRPQRIALEEHVGTEATLQDLARDWKAGRSDRHIAQTYTGANIPIRDLIKARHGKLPTQSPEQAALLIHHNTQAYIEAFRSVYALLEPKSATERPAALKHFELLLDAVLEPLSKDAYSEAFARVNAAESDLDVFIYEAQ